VFYGFFFLSALLLFVSCTIAVVNKDVEKITTFSIITIYHLPYTVFHSRLETFPS